MIKMRLKKKYRILLLFILFFLLIIILLLVFKRDNYNFNYVIYNVEVSQNYNKKDNYYEFMLNYQGKEFKEIISSKENYNDQIIKNISFEEKDDYKCFVFDSKYIKMYNICYSDDQYVGYGYINKFEESNKIIKTYNKLSIYDYNNKTFLIWDKDGLDLINKNKIEHIKLFSSEPYDIKLSYLKDNYFMIANYDQEYNFDSFIIYNLDNKKKSTFKLDNEISFNSYFMGENDKSVYLYDLKNKKEYEIVPFKEKIRKVNTKILLGGEWITKSDQSILNDKSKFSYSNIINYELINGDLYMNVDGYKSLVANEVKTMISYDNENVYYMKENVLYVYNIFNGEKKLLENFEWNFNYENLIFVY